MNFELFAGEIPDLALPSVAMTPPRKSTRLLPVVSGGMFELADTIGPERFAAVYCSGASAYYDAVGLRDARKDIGVVADLIRPRVAWVLKQYLHEGGKVFVDSGAFGVFQKWEKKMLASPVADFTKVFAVYDDLVDSTPAEFRFNLAIVAPDVVCDPEQSLALLSAYKSKVLAYVSAGVNVIVPIQRGLHSAGETTNLVKAILGTPDITIGIPSAAAAMDISDVATIRDHHRLHILGQSSMTISLYARAYAVLEHNPGAYLSCDANQIRAKTPEICTVQKQMISNGGLWEGEFDLTEVVHEVVNFPDWLSDSQVTAIAALYGVTKKADVKQWIRTHRESEDGLQSLLEECDPEGTMLWVGLPGILHAQAEKHLSARMRAPAVTQAFASAESQQAIRIVCEA